MSVQLLTNTINIPIDVDTNKCIDIVARHINTTVANISQITLHKLSIDARQRNNIHYVARYIITVDSGTVANCEPYIKPRDIFDCCTNPSLSQKVVIVGCGPAGLMCGRLLSQCGLDVTMIDRGGNIDKRLLDVQKFVGGGELDDNSNIQFGLGGAGTFSDGKLTTGISSALTYGVFAELVRCGAPQEIMYSSTPHIGTDKLVSIVANLRDMIIEKGGEFIFDSTVSSVNVVNGRVVGVTVVSNIDGSCVELNCDILIMAIGHSSRDTYEMLSKITTLQPKPFAVGLRIEHSRHFINQIQYGKMSLTHRDLSSASYRLATTLPCGRNCYSFCMCPGGVVVPATSERNAVVVNGMSNYDRLADNSNSALVVGVNVEDYYQGHCLDGVKFQRQLEQNAFAIANNGGNYSVPAQNVSDFINKKISKRLDVQCSYPLGYKSVNLWDILPDFVAQSIKEALMRFDKTMPGFAKEGILLAVESRTSSPVTIARNKDSLTSVDIDNMYPVGEGAGYAGGIVSASVDGLRVACKILGIDFNKC